MVYVRKAKGGGTNKSAKTPSKKGASITRTTVNKQKEDETAYEHLYRQVVINKEKKQAVKQKTKPVERKKTEVAKLADEQQLLQNSQGVAGSSKQNTENTVASVEEDGEEMLIEVGTVELQSTFPYEGDANNNSVRPAGQQVEQSAFRASVLPRDTTLEKQPDVKMRLEFADSQPGAEENEINNSEINNEEQRKTFLLMQNFMLQKGLIDPSMNDKQIQAILMKETTVPIPIREMVTEDNQQEN